MSFQNLLLWESSWLEVPLVKSHCFANVINWQEQYCVLLLLISNVDMSRRFYVIYISGITVHDDVLASRVSLKYLPV